MEAQTIFDVVNSLTGKVRPVGDAAIDAGRAKNLEVFIDVLEEMHYVVDQIAHDYENSPYASEKRMSELCNQCLDRIGIPKS